MTTIGQAICDEIKIKQDETAELIAVLSAIPEKALDIEMDSVYIWGPRWFRIKDTSGSLCARLLSAGFKSLDRAGRKRATSAGTQTGLFLPPSEELKRISFDVVQPGEDCQKVKVRITEERTISICGELPSNYEILEVLEEA